MVNVCFNDNLEKPSKVLHGWNVRSQKSYRVWV